MALFLKSSTLHDFFVQVTVLGTNVTIQRTEQVINIHRVLITQESKLDSIVKVLSLKPQIRSFESFLDAEWGCLHCGYPGEGAVYFSLSDSLAQFENLCF